MTWWDLGWDIGRVVVVGFNKWVSGEVVSDDIGRVGFKVGGEADSDNDSSPSKYFKYEVNVKVDGSVVLDVYIGFEI